MAKAKKYLVKKNIHRNEKYRFRPGDVIQAKDIKGAPLYQWVSRGILEVLDELEPSKD